MSGDPNLNTSNQQHFFIENVHLLIVRDNNTHVDHLYEYEKNNHRLNKTVLDNVIAQFK